MSGKKDKESRRLTKSIDKKMEGHLKHIEEAAKYDKAKFAVEFLQFQRTMPMWERVKLATSILFMKYWWSVKNIIMFWDKDKT